MDRLGLVIGNDRLRVEARRYGGPVALLAAATLSVVIVRATTAREAATAPATTARVRAVPAATAAVRPVHARRFATVGTGDTLDSIAARESTTVARLLALNPRIEPTALHVGQRVRVR